MVNVFRSHAGFVVLLALVFSAFHSCSEKGHTRHKVVFINSYHPGHPSSDEITDAIFEGLPADSFDLAVYYMDTKRNTSQSYIEATARRLADSIEHRDPDVLIVSDDNAVKYIVQPYIRNHNLPVVFCGVNGSDREYDLPHEQVTGMLEVLPVDRAIATVRSYYPTAEKLLVLNENTTTSRKEAVLLDTLYQRLGVEAQHALVDDFEQWKTTFAEGGKQYDFIYVVTHGAVADWDHREAVEFVERHIKVPVFTCEDFMMPYVVLGVTKVAAEQGLWAADAARQILRGVRPADIPVTRNQMVAHWLNSHMAQKIDFEPDSAFLNIAEIVAD